MGSQRLIRLAALWSLKYAAGESERQLSEVRRDLLNAYRLYVSPQTAKDPILQMLSDAGEPFCQSLVRLWQELISQMDELSPLQLFERLNKMLQTLLVMKSGREVREFIHEIMPGRNEKERNYREHVKSKLETVMSRLSSILQQQARRLSPAIAEIGLESQTPITPERKQLSKEKLRMFMMTPAAQQYGLDDLDVMTRLLEYPEARHLIVSLINAIERGRVPITGKEVQETAAEIKRIYDQRNQTNLPQLEEETLKDTE